MNSQNKHFSNALTFHDQASLPCADFSDEDIIDLLAVACDDRHFGRYLTQSAFDQEV
jgi:hypothetical protein